MVAIGELVLERLDRQVVLVLLLERGLGVIARGVLRAQLGLARFVLPSVGRLAGCGYWWVLVGDGWLMAHVYGGAL